MSELSPMTVKMIWFWASTLILATVLLFPVTKFIWVLRVRRMERKLERETSAEEREKERRSARFVSAVIVIVFAYLFNRTLIGQY